MSSAAKTTDYTEAEVKELARSGDLATRAELASRADLAPELLYFLAGDKSADVRRAVAKNAAAPRQTDMILAKDSDVEVRGGLAAKIAKVAPNLSTEDSSKIRAQTHEALRTLAADQITKVRAVLSDALKDVVDAPHDIVKMLANDLEIEVAGPVLEYSPVLSEADLVQIIEAGPANGAVSAVARRANISENLTDAIIGTDDVEGIASLLGNTSAQIRESALDDLIDRSRDIELWQAPLVTRPKLPAGAAQRMAGFLANNMIDALRQRSDLDGSTLDAISNIVKGRFETPIPAERKALAAGFDFLKVEPPIATAERLLKAKKLGDDVVFKALQAGDHAFVFAALIVRAGVGVSVARRIFIERSPQGVAALIAKAKLPGGMLVMTQQKMGKIAPGEVVHPLKDDKIPMTPDEVEWQIEFFTDMVARG